MQSFAFFDGAERGEMCSPAQTSFSRSSMARWNPNASTNWILPPKKGEAIPKLVYCLWMMATGSAHHNAMWGLMQKIHCTCTPDQPPEPISVCILTGSSFPDDVQHLSLLDSSRSPWYHVSHTV